MKQFLYHVNNLFDVDDDDDIDGDDDDIDDA